MHRIAAYRTWVFAGLLLNAPLLSIAAPPPPDGRPDLCEARPGGPRPHEPPFERDFDTGRPPFLMGLKLSDEQDDKVFAIAHAAAPALREQAKVVRAAHEALHAMVSAAQFSDSSAATAAQSQGKADGQLALLRLRLEHQVYAVLTPEQVAQLTAKHGDDFHHSGPQPGN